MNISASQINMYRVQSSNSIARAFQSQATPQSNQQMDQLSISLEGKAMRMALQQMRHENATDMKASMEAFSSAYESLGIGSLDSSTMSDEEIASVLQSFEEALGEAKPNHMRPSSEMSASERVDALKNLQSIGSDMQSGKGKSTGYGPPEGGPAGRPMRPQGPPPTGAKSSSTASETSDTLQALLDALSRLNLSPTN